jgi:hypothetical protein
VKYCKPYIKIMFVLLSTQSLLFHLNDFFPSRSSRCLPCPILIKALRFLFTYEGKVFTLKTFHIVTIICWINTPFLVIASSYFPPVVYIWAESWQNQQGWFATSMDPDQPAHPHSLIRFHAVRYQFLYS